jgi:hypothetical protein
MSKNPQANGAAGDDDPVKWAQSLVGGGAEKPADQGAAIDSGSGFPGADGPRVTSPSSAPSEKRSFTTTTVDPQAEIEELRRQLIEAKDLAEQAQEDAVRYAKEAEEARAAAAGAASKPKEVGRPVMEVAASTKTPGLVKWEGYLDRDKLAPRIKFEAPPSAAEAREAFLKAAGIVKTDHKVIVHRI